MLECELYKEKRNVPEGKMRKVNESGIESSGVVDSDEEKTIAILGDGWWLHTANGTG